MKLNDIYGSRVAGNPSVIKVDLPNMSVPTLRQRDKKLVDLENTVTKKMNDAVNKIVPPPNKKFSEKPGSIKIVSYEEAIKELANTYKKPNQ